MSINTLAPGTDVLAARVVEMRAHPHEAMSRRPDHAWETLVALVVRVLALDARVTTLDGRTRPQPDPLQLVAENIKAAPAGELHLSMSRPWTILNALVPRVLESEARLAAIERVATVEDPADVLAKMAAEIALDGFIHRHEGRFHEALAIMVVRVLDGEARAAKWQPAPAPAK